MFFKQNIDIKKEEMQKENTKGRNELEELLERKEALEKIGMLGANGIIEYKNILKRLEILKEEGTYTEWFHKNKKQLEELFINMRDYFVNNEGPFEIPYSEEKKLIFKNNAFYQEYLIELLTRYEYKCKDRLTKTGENQKLQIRYK